MTGSKETLYPWRSPFWLFGDGGCQEICNDVEVSAAHRMSSGGALGTVKKLKNLNFNFFLQKKLFYRLP